MQKIITLSLLLSSVPALAGNQASKQLEALCRKANETAKDGVRQCNLAKPGARKTPALKIPKLEQCVKDICARPQNANLSQLKLGDAEIAEMKKFAAGDEEPAKSIRKRISEVNAKHFQGLKAMTDLHLKSLPQMFKLSPDERVLQNFLWYTGYLRGKLPVRPLFAGHPGLSELFSGLSFESTLDEYYRSISGSFEKDLKELPATLAKLDAASRKILIQPGEEAYLNSILKSGKPPQDEQRFLTVRASIIVAARLKTDPKIRAILNDDQLERIFGETSLRKHYENALDESYAEAMGEDPAEYAEKQLKAIRTVLAKEKAKPISPLMLAAHKKLLTASSLGYQAYILAPEYNDQACMNAIWIARHYALPESEQPKLRSDVAAAKNLFLERLKGSISTESFATIQSKFANLIVQLPPSREKLMETVKQRGQLESEIDQAMDGIKLTPAEEQSVLKISLPISLSFDGQSPCENWVPQVAPTDLYNLNNTDVRFSLWSSRQRDWKNLLHHEFGHRIHALLEGLSEHTRATFEEAAGCISDVHEAYSPSDEFGTAIDPGPEDFADLIAGASSGADDANFMCGVRESFPKRKMGLTPLPGDAHSGDAFRLLQFEVSARGKLPESCAGAESFRSCLSGKP